MNAAAWQGPPTDVLGHPVPLQQFVARTARTVVALRHVIALPEGCGFSLHMVIRRGSLDEPAWKGMLEDHADGDPFSTPGGEDLRFGVRFPDDSKATTVDNAFRGWTRPTGRPEAPMLIDVGGESSSGDRSYQGDRRLWLWPLPLPEPFEFVLERRGMGIGETSVMLDGNAIVRAAEQALPYWPR
jgi:hypothetical protein